MVTGVKSHGTSIGNTAVILVVLMGEILIGKKVFKCPCLDDDHKGMRDPRSYNPPIERELYGLGFFVWPAVAAFCAGR